MKSFIPASRTLRTSVVKPLYRALHSLSHASAAPQIFFLFCVSQSVHLTVVSQFEVDNLGVIG